MMNRSLVSLRRKSHLVLALVALTAALLPAQNPFDPSRGGGGGRGYGRSSQELIGQDREEFATDAEFPSDHFTFLRLRHNGDGGLTDWPKADLNFTRRLHELTAIEVNPGCLNIEITDERLFQYPFAFMSDLRDVLFSADEEEALRKYLTNGGFIMVDDQWGDECWEHVYGTMKGIFPDKEPVELDIDHPIFSSVFKLDYLPQIPSHDAFDKWEELGLDNHYETKGFDSEDPEAMNKPHFRAWYDDNGRMMILVCHNNDIADGWEEESYKPEFFKKYSEKLCFPLGINIVFYALSN